MSWESWKTNSQTGAPPESPRLISVHVLAQFVFCPRAGVITSEVGSDDTGEDDDRPQRLDYLPDYDERLIRDSLRSKMLQFWLASVALLTTIVGGVWFSSRRLEWGVIVCIPMAVLAYWWLQIVSSIALLRQRLNAAMKATPREPDVSALCEEVFNWWELRRAGFQVDRVPEPYRDPGRGLIGRPWRVLRKGDLRIPVFRKHLGKQSIRDQHRVRIVAYCELILAAEASCSPYGLVLLPGSYEAVLIPNDAANQSLLKSALEQMQRMLAAPLTATSIAAPAATACALCPLGEPRALDPTKSDEFGTTAIRPPNPVTGVGGVLFHSKCGDRFLWTPPHDQARRLRIVLGRAPAHSVTDSPS